MTPNFDSTGVNGRTTDAPAWGAVVSMALGVFGLVTAEFLPASLLTPIAAELGISEGAAGQAVTATAVVGMVASLLITTFARRIDRRHLLMGFSALLIVSNLMVAFAPGLTFLLIGRVLLGIALGGLGDGDRRRHAPRAGRDGATSTVDDLQRRIGRDHRRRSGRQLSW